MGEMPYRARPELLKDKLSASVPYRLIQAVALVALQAAHWVQLLAQELVATRATTLREQSLGQSREQRLEQQLILRVLRSMLSNTSLKVMWQAY